jgi:agmatinase
MLDLKNFNQNNISNPNNNIFGLPSTEENADIIIINAPWEVTVSYGVGTSRAPEAILKASLQVDLYDPDMPDAWRRGYYLKPTDRKILLKSDFLRKEAELYLDYISKGEELEKNQFMMKTIKDINEGSLFFNNWIYQQARDLLDDNKLVALLGGDHSTPLGLYKALAEKHGEFGILMIDAHCDLRETYEGFLYSHASITYNALKEIPQIKNVMQVGVRDFGQDEWEYIKNSNFRVITYFDKEIKDRQYDGDTWKHITEEIVSQLPQKIHISFDIDGLDPKLCPNTGTPVPGGFEMDKAFYLFNKVLASGRQIIGFDLVEVGIAESDWNANVGARALFKLCNLLASSK